MLQFVHEAIYSAFSSPWRNIIRYSTSKLHLWVTEIVQNLCPAYLTQNACITSVGGQMELITMSLKQRSYTHTTRPYHPTRKLIRCWSIRFVALRSLLSRYTVLFHPKNDIRNNETNKTKGKKRNNEEKNRLRIARGASGRKESSIHV